MGKGSFHWNSSCLSWHCYTSIIGLGSEVRWETPAGQVGVLSWCHGWARGSKRQARRGLPVSWLGEKSSISCLFDTVIFSWQTEALLISCSAGQPRVRCVSESKSVRKQPKRGSCMNTVQMALSPEARGSGLESEVKTNHQGLWRTLCSSSKGPGHAKVM